MNKMKIRLSKYIYIDLYIDKAIPAVTNGRSEGVARGVRARDLSIYSHTGIINILLSLYGI